MNALAGLRVLDLSDRSAALAGRILGDLGAEVILVEPERGNSIRRWAPFISEDGESAAHQYFSANKRSVVLDIEADRAQFLGLVASADVLIETERPGRLDELGLDHASLRAVNPDLILSLIHI